MKITEMNFYRADEHLEDTLIIVKGKTHEEIVKQILKNQENAEKYNELIRISMTNDHILLDDAIEKIMQTIEIRHTPSQ